MGLKISILEVFCFAGPLTATALLLVLDMPHWSILAALATCPVVHVVLWVRAERQWDALIRELDSARKGLVKEG